MKTLRQKMIPRIPETSSKKGGKPSRLSSFFVPFFRAYWPLNSGLSVAALAAAPASPVNSSQLPSIW